MAVCKPEIPVMYAAILDFSIQVESNSIPVVLLNRGTPKTLIWLFKFRLYVANKLTYMRASLCSGLYSAILNFYF